MLSSYRLQPRGRLALPLVLLIFLSVASRAYAHPLQTPEFGVAPSPGCTTAGWTTGASGGASVAAMTNPAAGVPGPAGDCLAHLLAGAPGPSVAVLRQDFHVPAWSGQVWLTFDLLLQTAGGDPSLPAQYVGVFAASGGPPLCESWYNSNTGWFSYACNVSSLKGTDLSLRIRAHLELPGLQQVEVHVDNIRFTEQGPPGYSGSQSRAAS